MLDDVTKALADISPFSVSVSKFFQIGYVMKNYYSLFSQTDLNELLEYSFGFNAYMEHLTACRSFVIDGVIKKCSFIASSADADAEAAGADAAERPLSPIVEGDEGKDGDSSKDDADTPPPHPP